MAAAGDRPIDEDRGLLTDEDREFYRVQREARFDIPSRVSVGSAMGMVRPRPRPRRQLEVGDVPPEPLLDEPSAEDVVDIRVGVPNRVQRRTIGENQQSIAGDVLLWVKSSNQHTSATVDGGRSFPPTPLFSSPSDGGRGTRRWNAHQQPRSPPSLHRYHHLHPPSSPSSSRHHHHTRDQPTTPTPQNHHYHQQTQLHCTYHHT